MTPVSSINSAALLILQQTNSAAATPEREKTIAGDLIAIANGQRGTAGSSRLRAQAQSKIFESRLDLTELKVKLYLKVAEKLGVNPDSYATPREFASALRQAVSELKRQPNWQATIAGIEKELGLDKLGVSLETVIDSIANPNGESNKALTEALEAQIAKGETGAGGDEAVQPFAVEISEIGLYSPAKA